MRVACSTLRRHIHHYAYLGRIGSIAQWDGRSHGTIGIAIDDIACLEVDRGLVARLGFLRVELGDVQSQLGLAQLRLAEQCRIHPALHIVWRDLG